MDAQTNCDVIIIGAGVAGLRAAALLHQAGKTVRVLEAADTVGGRIRTTVQDGFCLDHGFQVLQTAYPQVKEALDLDALQLGYFVPGACVWDGKHLHKLADPLRNPETLLDTLRFPYSNFRDTIRVALLKSRLLLANPDKLYAHQELSTERFLTQKGFSEDFINGFFRPLFSGIFLEEELASSSVVFEFVFSMLAKGHAALPTGGMQAIPNQLRTSLPDDAVQTSCRVQHIEKSTVRTQHGTTLHAKHILIATDQDTAGKLHPTVPTRPWNTTTCHYFSCSENPLPDRFLALNSSQSGPISSISVPSSINPSYAPQNQHLLSVSLRPQHNPSEESLINEIRHWTKIPTLLLTPLQAFSIPHALPRQLPADNPFQNCSPKLDDHLWICGDHRFSSSLEGALASAQIAANAILTSA